VIGTPYDFFVQFHLTARCNLRCRHCYQTGGVPEMNFEEVSGAIDNVRSAIEGWAIDHQMEVSPSFHFTGGEPLLRRDLFDILDYARESGFSLSLMSNGTLVDRDTARRLREARVKDVQVSLDGLEATHDRLRGRGAFSRAMQGIRSLVSEGVETNFNLTVSRLNMAEVAGLVRLAEELGVGGAAFSRLVPMGRGKELSSHSLTPEELAGFHQELRLHRSDARVAVTSRDPLATVADMRGEPPQTKMPVGGCAAGVFGVTINCDGTVMPCRRMDLPIGNIRETSFRELWVDSPVLWALRTREDYHDGCGSCLYWSVCRGCRAIALAYARAHGSEDYLGPDPQCPYRQPTLKDGAAGGAG
jgi:radical SAM protein with 4Fe4S-binding SPASM domain